MALNLVTTTPQIDGIAEFFNLYFSYVGATEAPVIYHRWSIIGGISAILSRNVHLKFGHGKIYPNLYLLLIGEPGARKSSAIGITKKAVKSTGFNCLSAARTTPEKFIGDLEENGIREGEGASQIFILEDEFLDFIGSKNDSFVSLLTKLFDNHDDFPYRLKNSATVNVNEPTVQILGGMTHATFAMAFSPEILETGFLSRLLLIYSEKTKIRHTWPSMPDPNLQDLLNDKLKELRLFYSGSIGITHKANIAIDAIYKTFEDTEDTRFRHYCSRRHTQLLKLCIIVASIEKSLSLQEHHVIWANTLLVSIEDRFSKALGAFGKAKNADTTSKIMNALYEADRPLTSEDLWKIVVSDLDSLIDLGKILNGLFAANQIIRVESGTGGYLPKEKVTKRLPYVDMSLLDASEIPPGYL